MSNRQVFTASAFQSIDDFLKDMMEFAQAKHQQGHQIFQVAFDTIFVNNHEVTHGIVLFSNKKVNNNYGKLKYKLEYSQTQSAKDFYNYLETVASDLTETGNKIHCISVDSLSSYFGLTLAETTYCLMVYSKDVDDYQHETGLRIIKADDKSSYDDFVESMKIEVEYIHKNKHRVMHVGTDSFLAGISILFRKEHTIGFIFYDKSRTENLPKRIHLLAHQVKYTSIEKYEHLLNWVVTQSESKNLISVNLDEFIIPGKVKRRKFLPIINWLQYVAPDPTLACLICFYS